MWELSRLVESQVDLNSAEEVNEFLREAISPREPIQMEKVTPLETSSAGVVRHRLNRGGNCRLNAALYRIVLTQAHHFT
jgi:hypothetical protein